MKQKIYVILLLAIFSLTSASLFAAYASISGAIVEGQNPPSGYMGVGGGSVVIQTGIDNPRFKVTITNAFNTGDNFFRISFYPGYYTRWDSPTGGNQIYDSMIFGPISQYLPYTFYIQPTMTTTPSFLSSFSVFQYYWTPSGTVDLSYIIYVIGISDGTVSLPSPPPLPWEQESLPYVTALNDTGSDDGNEKCPYCGQPKHPLEFIPIYGGLGGSSYCDGTSTNYSSGKNTTSANTHYVSSHSSGMTAGLTVAKNSGGRTSGSSSASSAYGFLPNLLYPFRTNLTNNMSTNQISLNSSLFDPNPYWAFNNYSLLSSLTTNEDEEYTSPGFPEGWAHNYDIILKADSGANTWQPLELIYPTGVSEQLEPVLTGGTPNGNFNTNIDSPMIVTGVKNNTTNVWNSVTISWKNNTKWIFSRHDNSDIYVLSAMENALGKQMTLFYDTDRKLTIIKDDDNSVMLTYNYDINDIIYSTVDCYGKKVIYDATSAQLNSISQPVPSSEAIAPLHTEYTYTTINYKSAISSATIPSPSGTGTITENFVYDNEGKAVSKIDANGVSRNYNYDYADEEETILSTTISVTDSEALTVQSWSKQTDGIVNTGTTDAYGNGISYEYEDTNNPTKPTKTIFKDDSYTETTYDIYGNITEYVDITGSCVNYNYNYSSYAFGRLMSIVKDNVTIAQYTYYEPSGLIATESSPMPGTTNGTMVTTSYTYDSLGNILTVTSPGSSPYTTRTTTYNYTTDGNYSTTAKIGQPLTITDELGNINHYRYDSCGNPVSHIDPMGNETEYEYNIADQLTMIILPKETPSSVGNGYVELNYGYVGGSLLSEIVYDEDDTLVSAKYYTYGDAGELLTVTGTCETVSYAYDALYRLKSLTDGNGNETLYNYDQLNRLTTIVYPEGDVVYFTEYDDNDNLLQKMNGNNGIITNYTYNSNGWLTDISYPAYQSRNVSFTYDAWGNIYSMTDATGTTTYARDTIGRPIAVSSQYTGLGAKVISYGYNPDGSRSAMSVPLSSGAGIFYYNYDALGRLTQLINPYSETFNWTYDDNGRVTSEEMEYVGVTEYAYNGLSQLVELNNYSYNNTANSTFNASRDILGKVQSIDAASVNANLTGTTDYTYNLKGQLISASSDRATGYSDTFTYDSAGNNLFMAQYFNDNNQPDDNNFQYDNRGNPVVYDGNSLTFTPDNKLLTFGSLLSADYRGDGLRAWKENGEESRIYYIYDGNVPIMELDYLGEVTDLITRVGYNVIARDGIYYQKDIEGNAAHRIDILTGGILSSDVYDAYGNIVYGGDNDDPFGYKIIAGYYKDEETGLYLLTHRYYDPYFGRFLTRDPISYNGGINLYGYTANDPVNLIDPIGYAPPTGKTPNWLDKTWGKAKGVWENTPICVKIGSGLIGTGLLIRSLWNMGNEMKKVQKEKINKNYDFEEEDIPDNAGGLLPDTKGSADAVEEFLDQVRPGPIP